MYLFIIRGVTSEKFNKNVPSNNKTVNVQSSLSTIRMTDEDAILYLQTRVEGKPKNLYVYSTMPSLLPTT